MLLLVRKTMPAKDLKEFIEWLKAHPDKARGARGTSLACFSKKPRVCSAAPAVQARAIQRPNATGSLGRTVKCATVSSGWPRR
jgi:hypothetical protein